MFHACAVVEILEGDGFADGEQEPRVGSSYGFYVACREPTPLTQPGCLVLYCCGDVNC